MNWLLCERNESLLERNTALVRLQEQKDLYQQSQTDLKELILETGMMLDSLTEMFDKCSFTRLVMFSYGKLSQLVGYKP